MCAAVLFGYSPFPQPSEPQFLVCECPADVRPGDTFHVEILRQGAGRRLPLQGVLLWRSKPRQAANRVMQVQAPPGIAPGQTFFVPLVAPPVVRVGGKGTTFEPSATSTRQQPLASTSSASKSSTSTIAIEKVEGRVAMLWKKKSEMRAASLQSEGIRVLTVSEQSCFVVHAFST